MIWFTADCHLGHTNMLKFQPRPFDTIEEHDEVIIGNINANVVRGDTLFILGDFTMRCSLEQLQAYRNRIKCKDVWLIRGNHDSKYVKKVFGPDKVRDLYRVRPLPLKMPTVLCHYALREWDGSYYGCWHLYGHSHGHLPDDRSTLSFDVGVDCWGYAPISFDQVQTEMEDRIDRGALPIRHH